VSRSSEDMDERGSSSRRILPVGSLPPGVGGEEREDEGARAGDVILAALGEGEGFSRHDDAKVASSSWRRLKPSSQPQVGSPTGRGGPPWRRSQPDIAAGHIKSVPFQPSWTWMPDRRWSVAEAGRAKEDDLPHRSFSTTLEEQQVPLIEIFVAEEEKKEGQGGRRAQEGGHKEVATGKAQEMMRPANLEEKRKAVKDGGQEVSSSDGRAPVGLNRSMQDLLPRANVLTSNPLARGHLAALGMNPPVHPPNASPSRQVSLGRSLLARLGWERKAPPASDRHRDLLSSLQNPQAAATANRWCVEYLKGDSRGRDRRLLLLASSRGSISSASTAASTLLAAFVAPFPLPWESRRSPPPSCHHLLLLLLLLDGPLFLSVRVFRILLRGGRVH